MEEAQQQLIAQINELEVRMTAMVNERASGTISLLTGKFANLVVQVSGITYHFWMFCIDHIYQSRTSILASHNVRRLVVNSTSRAILTCTYYSQFHSLHESSCYPTMLIVCHALSKFTALMVFSCST